MPREPAGGMPALTLMDKLGGAIDPGKDDGLYGADFSGV
jgi:hypothetical protein